MKTYAHPLADVTEEEIENNPAFPLVRELEYKYGLKVIGQTPERRRLYLVDGKGFYAGEAAYKDDNYLYRSVTMPKDRGQGDSRYEYYSTKLPALMGTLKRQKAVQTGQDLFDRIYRESFMHAIALYDEQFGSTDKKNECGGAHQHVLLQIIFNNRELHTVPQESINYFKTALDTFDKVDILVEQRRNELKETFNNPIWVACLDKTGTYLVGKVRINPTWNVNYQRNLDPEQTMITEVEPFKRVKNILEDVPELRHRLVMAKTFMEQHSRLKEIVKLDNDIFPVAGRRYIPEVNIVLHNGDHWSSYDNSKPRWVFFL